MSWARARACGQELAWAVEGTGHYGLGLARYLTAAGTGATPAPPVKREALRLLMIDRDNAVQSIKTARTVLASVIVTAPADLREQLRHPPCQRRATTCAALICPADASLQTPVLCQTLTRLGQRDACPSTHARQV